jgi:hypothetical protein
MKKLGQPKTKPVKKPDFTKPGTVLGKLVPGRNGGQIWQGPALNHVPGTGRPPSEIRAAMRHALDTEVMFGILRKWKAGELDDLDVGNFLAKYGLGEKNELTVISPEIKAKIQTQVDIIGSKASWDSQELLNQLSEVWK